MMSLMVTMTLGGLFDSEEQDFYEPNELEKEELPLFASSPGHTVFGEYVGAHWCGPCMSLSLIHI